MGRNERVPGEGSREGECCSACNTVAGCCLPVIVFSLGSQGQSTNKFDRAIHMPELITTHEVPQEMRRPAPQERPAKRQRSSPAEQREGDAEGQELFQELGRFDYAAADSLSSGAQGFLLTCGFRRHALLLFFARGTLVHALLLLSR